MPMYEYECSACGTSFEMLRSMSQADAETPCKACGSTSVKRKLSRFASFASSDIASVDHHHSSGGGSCSSGLCGCSGSSCSF